jgi:hypothetical protein
VPHNVWLLLALGIVLAIGGAAWLWLFQSDVVRPLLLRWTSSASAPPRSVALIATLDRDRLTVEWDGRSPVFLNPMSVQLVFEFAAAEPTRVPLRPDEAQRGYFTTSDQPSAEPHLDDRDPLAGTRVQADCLIPRAAERAARGARRGFRARLTQSAAK